MSQSTKSMTRVEADALLSRVSAILTEVDAAAQTAHAAAGGDLQGWDNQIVLACGLPVEEKHHARGPWTWATPEGWEPSAPAGADDLTYDEGALWGEESEEYGVAAADDAVSGLVRELAWLQSNTSGLAVAGWIDGGTAWVVRGEVGGTRFDLTPDLTDDQIRAELEDCFAVFAD